MGFDVRKYLSERNPVPLTQDDRRALEGRPLALRALEACNGVVFVPPGPVSEWRFRRERVVMGYDKPYEQVVQWSKWLRRSLCVIGSMPSNYAWICLDDDGACFVIGFAELDWCLKGPGGWEETLAALMDGCLLSPVLAPGEECIEYYGKVLRRGDPELWEP